MWRVVILRNVDFFFLCSQTVDHTNKNLWYFLFFFRFHCIFQWIIGFYGDFFYGQKIPSMNAQCRGYVLNIDDFSWLISMYGACNGVFPSLMLKTLSLSILMHSLTLFIHLSENCEWLYWWTWMSHLVMFDWMEF